jgi:hypothetical protein
MDACAAELDSARGSCRVIALLHVVFA